MWKKIIQNKNSNLMSLVFASMPYYKNELTVQKETFYLMFLDTLEKTQRRIKKEQRKVSNSANGFFCDLGQVT